MDPVVALPLPSVADPAAAQPVCRCGHCRTVLDAHEQCRRVRCPECGRSNAVPAYVHVTCERCNEGQRIRFSKRNDPPLCVNCGHSFHIREVELTVQQRHIHIHGGREHAHQRDGAAFTILLYAGALILFLAWLIQY